MNCFGQMTQFFLSEYITVEANLYVILVTLVLAVPLFTVADHHFGSGRTRNCCGKKRVAHSHGDNNCNTVSNGSEENGTYTICAHARVVAWNVVCDSVCLLVGVPGSSEYMTAKLFLPWVGNGGYFEFMSSQWVEYILAWNWGLFIKLLSMHTCLHSSSLVTVTGRSSNWHLFVHSFRLLDIDVERIYSVKCPGRVNAPPLTLQMI